MQVVKYESKQMTVATLDSFKKLDKVVPWIYKNPVYSPEQQMVTMDKADSRFNIPEKIYGDTERIADYIIKDYHPDCEPLGVLLVGAKGMGKSMLSEFLGDKLMDHYKVPVIHVTRETTALAVDKAVSILAPCIVLLEEFEKCFRNESDIPVILNMLSSSTLRGVLFVISANHIDSVTYGPLLNRPQRLRYRINYNTMSDELLDEILSDYELTPEQKQVYQEWAKGTKSNVDSTICLVRMSKHIHDPAKLVEFIGMLNVPKMLEPSFRVDELTITGWDFGVISTGRYSAIVQSALEDDMISISIGGQNGSSGTDVKSFQVDVSEGRGDRYEEFTMLDKEIGEITIRLKLVSVRTSPKNLKFNFRITKMFEGKPLELIKDARRVVSNTEFVPSWM